jgi:hypothetical protein
MATRRTPHGIQPGCPKAMPVVCCPGHQVDNEEGAVSYKAAIYKFWQSLPSLP